MILDDIGDEAEFLGRVAVIQYQRSIFALSFSQRAADNLNVQHSGTSWASKNQTPHVPIHSGGQCAHIANDLISSVMKLSFDLGALKVRRVSILIAT